MKRQLQLHLIVWLWVISVAAIAQPTDNPYRTKYPGAPSDHWTENLMWSRVVDITTVQGANWLHKIQKAQDSLVRQGGGVIFFPAGDYFIHNSIVLRPNIILRGVQSIDNVAKSRGFAPQSRLSFPEYIPSFSGNGTPDSSAFKTITSPSSFNNALVDLDVNRGRIALSQGGGTSNVGAMVLNVRSNNVAVVSPDVPSATQHPWQRFSFRFGYNIVVRNFANAIIANCRVNDFTNNDIHPLTDDSFYQPGYLADSAGVAVVVPTKFTKFSYTDHYGISCNRGNSQTYGTPQTTPDLFRTGCEVLDNWILKTMRVGIMAAGLGLKIKRNVIVDSTNKEVWLRPQGTAKQTNNSATYENRGMDFSGWSVEVDSNEIDVYRHKFYRNNYMTIDGEGILVQECCGGTSVNDYKIRGNNMLNGYIGIYKMRDIQNLLIEGNNCNARTNIYIAADVNNCGPTNTGRCYTMQNVVVRNNYGLVGGCSTNPGAAIVFEGNVEGKDVFCYNNVGVPAPNASCNRTIDSFRISAPCYVSLNPDPTQPNVNTNVNLFRASCSTPIIPAPAIIPAVTIASPTDNSVVDATQGNTNLTVQTNLTFDPNNNVEVEYWLDAQLIATLNSQQTAAIDQHVMTITPAMQGRRVLTARIRDNSLTPTRYAFSPPVTIFVQAPLSLNEELAKQVKVYPNPVSAGDRLLVQVPDANLLQHFELMSITGAVQQVNVDSYAGQLELNTTGLSKGVYILKLAYNGTTISKKVIIQ